MSVLTEHQRARGDERPPPKMVPADLADGLKIPHFSYLFCIQNSFLQMHIWHIFANIFIKAGVLACFTHQFCLYFKVYRYV
jgi:hypothetical protein